MAENETLYCEKKIQTKNGKRFQKTELNIFEQKDSNGITLEQRLSEIEKKYEQRLKLSEDKLVEAVKNKLRSGL